MFRKKLNTLFIVSFVFSALIASVANAHPRWVLPSQFTVSKEGGEWVTFDVTASHGTFVMDKPAGSETARIVMPDGRQERPNFVLLGKRRSVFDFYFEEEGTHKVRVNMVPSYSTYYKVGKRDTKKRLKANKAERAASLPEGARDVETTLWFTRAETYINVGKPNDKALELQGQYLELFPITHPADIVAEEPVKFQLFFNGKPQQGVKAEITREGTLYRNQSEQIDVVSDEHGFIEFTPEIAGRYLLKSLYKTPLENNQLADNVGASIHFTFEVVLP